jgi:uncharacterized protein YkwD
MKQKLLAILCRSCVLVVFVFPVGPYLPPAATLVTPPQPVDGQTNFTSLFELGQDFTGCGGSLVPVQNSQYEARVVELVNAERTSRGIPPLKRISLLDDASRYHARDMADDDYFEHDSYDRVGSNLVYSCFWYTRVTSYYPGWSILAENIAAGYSSPEQVMSGWMSSPGHRDNILRDSTWEIGVGYFHGGDYSHYWVQDFGKRSGNYPIIINNDAVSTSMRDVSLYIYDSWTEMRLRNNSGEWTVWQPFSNTPSWQLPAETGSHSVTVELRKTGQTASSSDTIFLDYPIQPMLGNLPDIITMTYSIQTQTLMPPLVQVTPENVGNTSVLTWRADTADNWFRLVPPTGSTPQEISVIPTNFTTDTVSTYTGLFTTTVLTPAGVAGSPHQTAVRLFVIADPIQYTYLPSLFR